MKKILLPVFLISSVILLVFSAGCSGSDPGMTIDRFEPIINPPKVTASVKNNESFINFKNNKYEITAGLFEAQSIMVMPISIANKSDNRIDTADYSISLHDGRDYKVIERLSRDTLITAKGKIEGNGSISGGIEQQVISTLITTVMSLTSVSQKNQVLQGMDMAVNNYFSFRPIYAHETRSGVLCFVIDFKPEFPLTLKIKLKDEIIHLQFMPKKESAQANLTPQTTRPY